MADAAAYALGRRFLCTRQMATLFCVKIWRHGRRLESVTHTSKTRLRQSMHEFTWRTVKSRPRSLISTLI